MTPRLRIACQAALCAFVVAALHADDALESADDSEVLLDDYIVTAATRTEKAASSLPVTTTIVEQDDLQRQLALSGDPMQALANVLPSFSPSRQKMTGYGESFRGRSPLILVDGVPQSNPLRDSSREGYTVDVSAVERIEVVHGASAAQGMGATGGIINIVTKSAPADNGVRQSLEVSGTSSDEFTAKGLGGKAAYSLGWRDGAWSFVGSASYEWRGMAYDGDGNLVGVDNTQGDTMNSQAVDVFAKVGYALTPARHLQLMVNRFRMEQDLGYVSVAGDHAAGVPTLSVEGATPGDPARNDVLTAAVTYSDTEFAQGSLTIDAFRQDFSATFGGGTFATFIQDGVRIFDQSQNNSLKHGVKVTWARTFESAGNLGVVTGVDVLNDRTDQVLAQTGRFWVPETTFQGWSPYLQLEKPFGRLSLHGGIRHEIARLEVGDFETLEFYGSQQVAGGSPRFEEPLFNLGGVFKLGGSWRLFGGYSQGFSMPDVGRVLRAINVPGQDVASFLGLEPVVTDNYELGVKWFGRRARASLSTYVSTSALGSRLEADADGIYSVVRERTEIVGAELQGSFSITARDAIGGYVSIGEGKSDRDGDGDVDTRLAGVNISPAKLALNWRRDWSDTWSTYVQLLTYFDRDDPLGRPQYDFDGYTTLDLVVSRRVANGVLTLGVQNLLDRQYISYYSQTTGNNLTNFAGTGRSLLAKYRMEF